MRRLEIECESYEDIFELSDTSQIILESFMLMTQEISNFSANKLIFDIA